MTTTGSTTFTTTMRVINRVHGHTANGRTDTLPALGASLAQRTQAVLVVRDFAQGRAALGQNLAHFTGAQADGDVSTFASDQLNRCTCRTSELSALARLELDAVDGGTHRNVAQRQGVAGLDRRMGARDQLVTGTDALRRDDVATLTVGIFQQRDVGSTVRIVFHALDDGRNAILVAAEVDQTVVLLVTTANVASGDTAVVVTTAGLGLLFDQRSVRSALVQILVDHLDDKAATSRSRFAFNDCHDAPLYSALLAKSRSWPGWRAIYAFFQSLRLPMPRMVRLVLPCTL